jgi:gliding motility-associated-like protein
MLKTEIIRILLLINCLFFIALPGVSNSSTPFVENKGQWHRDVLFKAAIPGGDLYVMKNRLKYVFYQWHQKGHHHGFFDEESSAMRGASQVPDLSRFHQAVEVSFVRSNEDSRITGQGDHFSNINFIKGDDPGKWASGIHSYSQIQIKDLYEGVDLVIYTNEYGLKYDLIVSPGIEPSSIRMKYKGHNSLLVQEGKLLVSTIFGEVSENPPFVYTLDGNKKKAVEAAFQVQGDEVSFHFPDGYDQSQLLVIDPELIFSTYSGSTADNWGFSATYDEEGNLYSGGIVFDTGFPVTTGVYQPGHGGEWDVGILKYDPTGKNLVWATYLGGSFSETPQSIIVNSKGQLVIYGTTSSPDFPMTTNSFNTSFLGGDPIYDTASVANPRLVGGIPMRNGTDIFLAVLSQDGKRLEGSTFIGGSGNDGIMERLKPLTKNYGDQFRGEVIVDKEDNIYVASNTSSSDFFVKGGVQATYGGDANDGIVMKFNDNLSDLAWSTYVGGTGIDALYSIKVDSDGNVFAAGGTNSIDFPVTPGTLKTEKTSSADIDGVVVKLKNDGSEILSATYLGTTDYDQAYFIELDSSNRVYLLGQTRGDYLVTSDVYSNAHGGQFIHKITNDLDSTFFSTTIGSGSGSPDFSPTAFLVNECENIFISGWGGILNHPAYGYIGGSTTGLPVTDNAFQSQTDGTDFYLMVLLQDARQLLYGTFFGEINGREHVDGGTSRFDKKGIVYQSVCGGCGGSSGFPTWPPDVWSTTNNSSNCNNAAFKFDLASLLARFETDTEDFSNRGIRDGCYPLTLVFLNESLGGEDFFWEFGEGTVTDQEDSITIIYEHPGVYPVVLTATDINTCVRESKATGTITVHDYEFGIMPDDSICFGENITLMASGGVQYDWAPKSSLQNSETATPLASPDTTTVYSVDIIDANGCAWEDSLAIKVIPKITADFTYSKAYDCHEGPVVEFTNKSENASFFHWEFGDGVTSDDFETTHKFEEADTLKTYRVQLTAGESICSEKKEESITTVTPFVPNFISPNGDDKNDVFEVRIDGQIELNIYNRWGRPVYKDDNYQNDWGSDDLASGVYFYEIIFSDKNTRCNGWVHVMH